MDACRNMCQGISRILRSGGYHIHISFAQPHFRKKYLLGQHSASNVSLATDLLFDKDVCEFHWDLECEKIGGDNASGCFHHFMYVMRKR